MPTAAEKLDAYRRDINLIDFLEGEGFRVNPKKGPRHGKWVLLQDADGGRKLLVTRAASGQYQFFNPEDDRDRGTIVDYVAAKLGADLRGKDGWRQLFEYLDRHQGHVQPVASGFLFPNAPPVPTGGSLSPEDFCLKPLTDPTYLLSRGITEKTLGSAEFWGKIFNRDHLDQRGFRHTNTVFPLEDEGGLAGIIIRNRHANYINGNKAGGLWVSNAVGEGSPAELFVCESPIDALSYHQVQPPDSPGGRVYVATAGTLSAAQPGAIQALIDRLRPQRVVLANDNDLSGMRYNLQLLGALSVGKPQVLEARVTRFAAAGCLLALRPAPGGGLSTDGLAQTFARHLGGDNRVDIRVLPSSTNESTLTVAFPRDRPFLLRAERALLEVCGGGLEIRRPVEKDWNDELAAVQRRQARQALASSTKPTFGGRHQPRRFG